MRSTGFRKFIVRLVSLSMLSIGFMQASGAAIIGTQQFLESDARTAREARVEAFLTRQDVAKQLVAFGVDPQQVQTRVSNMTNAELITLEGRLDKHVAGGDAIAVIGVVFLVLIILELMGITDVFTAT